MEVIRSSETLVTTYKITGVTTHPEDGGEAFLRNVAKAYPPTTLHGVTTQRTTINKIK
jgi:hypothetical protein